jgi:hypothetical protein
MLDPQATTNLLLALAALLGVATGATALFVTRFEYRDLLRRLARMEREHEAEGGSDE